MKKIAIVVKSLGHNDLTLAIQQLAENNPELDLLVFFKNMGRPKWDVPCPQISIADLYGYYGSVIATDLDSARILETCPGPYQKIFYPWDLEWLRMPKFLFDQLNYVYNSKETVKLCRSTEHGKLLQNCFGATYNVCESLEKIVSTVVEPGRSYLDQYLGIDQFYEYQR